MNGTKKICCVKDKDDDMISTNSYALAKDVSENLIGRLKGLIDFDGQTSEKWVSME